MIALAHVPPAPSLALESDDWVKDELRQALLEFEPATPEVPLAGQAQIAAHPGG